MFTGLKITLTRYFCTVRSETFKF